MKKIIPIILLALSVICVIIGVSKYMEEKNAGKEYEEIRELAKLPVDETESEDDSEPEVSVEAEDDVNSEEEVKAEENAEAEKSTETETDVESEKIIESEADVKPEPDTEAKENIDSEEDDTEIAHLEDSGESDLLPDVTEIPKPSYEKPEATVIPHEASLSNIDTDEDVIEEEVQDELSEEETSRVTVSYEEDLVIPVDFEALQKVNSDIYAWIEVAGTKVDYPIVQDKEDDTFYLDHSVEKKKAVEGAIFTELYNNKDFEDPNTVIYGHNMKNGTMFQTLHSFSDREFFNKNREVTVYMPDQIRHYEIFAAYLYDSRHILQTYDFSDKQIYRYYLREVLSQRDMNSFVDASYNLNETDKLLTLSTCYRGIDTNRFLVQAVLVSIENKI